MNNYFNLDIDYEINRIENNTVILEQCTDKLVYLCKKYELNTIKAFSVAWAILLSKYSYSKEVSFIYEDDHLRQVILDGTEKTIHQIIMAVNGAKIVKRSNDTIIITESSEKKGLGINVKKNSIELFLNIEEHCIDYSIIDSLADKMQIIFSKLSRCEEMLNRYNILTKQDYDRYEKLNNCSNDYTVDKTVNELIDLQCKKTPNNIAVYANSKSYTYKEIYMKANSLAERLTKVIDKGEYIPVLMDKSIELIISIYAIMKAGGVFIPLDSKWPSERIKQVLEATEAKIILVDNEHDDLYEKRVLIEYQDIELSNINVNNNVSIDDNIYAIFTSGTTGIPKGAINKHKGIVNRFLYMNKRYQICSEDVILLTANHAFDSAVWQMFWPLINGNPVVIPKSSVNFDIISIIKAIEKYQVTITDFVPSVFNLLVDFITIKKKYLNCLTSLRQLLIGGEEMISEYIYRFKEMYPKCSITNTYGPAETSIGTVFYELPEKRIERIPIGKPIDNVKIYIFNIDGELMPVGARGMMYLGGICVGAGYVNNSEQTNKVFCTKNIVGKEEELYITGDIVRINNNDIIDFYGRIDNQVKINGVRIELSEIEKKILSNDAVEKCCVICTKKGSKKFINAFYTSSFNLEESKVRDYLLNKLPKSMMPHNILQIEKMPLNLNGKIDIKVLQSYI